MREDFRDLIDHFVHECVMHWLYLELMKKFRWGCRMRSCSRVWDR